MQPKHKHSLTHLQSQVNAATSSVAQLLHHFLLSPSRKINKQASRELSSELGHRFNVKLVWKRESDSSCPKSDCIRKHQPATALGLWSHLLQRRKPTTWCQGAVEGALAHSVWLWPLVLRGAVPCSPEKWWHSSQGFVLVSFKFCDSRIEDNFIL